MLVGYEKNGHTRLKNNASSSRVYTYIIYFKHNLDQRVWWREIKTSPYVRMCALGTLRAKPCSFNAFSLFYYEQFLLRALSFLSFSLSLSHTHVNTLCFFHFSFDLSRYFFVVYFFRNTSFRDFLFFQSHVHNHLYACICVYRNILNKLTLVFYKYNFLYNETQCIFTIKMYISNFEQSEWLQIMCPNQCACFFFVYK